MVPYQQYPNLMGALLSMLADRNNETLRYPVIIVRFCNPVQPDGVKPLCYAFFYPLSHKGASGSLFKSSRDFVL